MAVKNSWIVVAVKIKLRILSVQRRVSSRIIRDPWDRALSMLRSSGISRRAGDADADDDTDMVRLSRFKVGWIRAMRVYCFWERARPFEVEMRKNSLSYRSP
jgi:hypothetical protein